MPFTWTAASGDLRALANPARTASNIGCRALYTRCGSVPILSAFAKLLAVAFSRTDCALMPEPAMSKILKEGMAEPRYWQESRRVTRDARRDRAESAF